MDDLVEFILSFGRQWITIMSGIGSLILTGLGLSSAIPARPAFLVGGLLCMLVASFFVWRNEHRKIPPAEDPVIAERRDSSFRVQVDSLSADDRGVLVLFAVDGESSSRPALQSIANRTKLVVRENELWRLNHLYRSRIEAWAVEMIKTKS